MSLQLLEAPAYILGGNVAPFRFRKFDVLTTAGNKCYRALAIYGGSVPLVSDILELEWGDELITFTFPGADGLDATKLDKQSDDPVAYAALHDYVNALAKQIARHPIVARDFDVQMVTPYGGTGVALIAFAAREAHADYDLQAGGANTVNWFTATGSTYSAGLTATAITNYRLKMYLNLTIDVLNNPTTVRHELVADGNINEEANYADITFYDIAELAKQLMDKYDEPPVNAYLIEHLRYGLVKVDFEVFESFNDDEYRRAKVQRFNDLTVPVFLEGMDVTLPVDVFPAVTNFDDYINTSASPYKRFLTHQERTKLIDDTQPEFLCWWNDTAASRRLRVKIYYTDATDTTESEAWTAKANTIYRLPVGYTQRALADVTPAKTVLKYEVWVDDGAGNILSETMTYVIDTRYRRYPKYLVYKNSLGGWDTTGMGAAASYESKIATETVGYAEQNTSSTAIGLMAPTYTERDTQITFRSGPLEDETAVNYFDDLISSPYIVLYKTPYIEPDEDRYYEQRMTRLVLAQNALKKYDEDDFTWQVELKLQRAYTERGFSNQTAVAVPLMPDYVEFIVNVASLGVGTNSITLTMLGDDMTAIVNGEAYTINTPFIVTETGAYTFVAKGRNLTFVQVQKASIGGGFRFVKIESGTIAAILVDGFSNMTNVAYLSQRLAKMQSIATLMITSSTFLRTDDILTAMAKKQRDYTGVTLVSTNGSAAASSYGSQMKNYLTWTGATVTP